MVPRFLKSAFASIKDSRHTVVWFRMCLVGLSVVVLGAATGLSFLRVIFSRSIWLDLIDEDTFGALSEIAFAAMISFSGIALLSVDAALNESGWVFWAFVVPMSLIPIPIYWGLIWLSGHNWLRKFAPERPAKSWIGLMVFLVSALALVATGNYWMQW